MRKEKALIVTQRKVIADQLRRELRRAGISFVTVIDSAPRALSALWAATPDFLFLDLGGDKVGILDVLPVFTGAGKKLCNKACFAIGSFRSSEQEELLAEQKQLKEFGITHCISLNHKEDELTKTIQGVVSENASSTDPSVEEQKVLLFLNDRNRTYLFRNRLAAPGRTIQDCMDVEALCRTFMDDTPDVVFMDPRGMGSSLPTIEKVTALFPECRIYFVMPLRSVGMWASRQPAFVKRVVEYPEGNEDYGKLLALLEPERKAAQKVEEVQEPENEEVQEEEISQTILVVDDDFAVRAMMLQFLQHCGYDTLEAEDGRAALDVLRASKVDMLISDIYMPRMNGFQLFMEVRNNWPKLPVVLITGYNSAAKDMASYSISEAEFLEKPFELNTVAALVKSKLAG